MLDRLTLRLVGAFVASCLVFLLWPGLDTWFSSLFWDGRAFPLVRSQQFEFIRNVIWTASTVTVLGTLGLWLAWLTLGPSARVPARLWGWILALYLAGPGILVNGVLKEHWGRARPAQVFDGSAEFSRPFAIADECVRNCSFVSGEGAAAAALAIVVGALAWPSLGVRGRRVIGASLVAMAAGAAMMRVLTGRHYLSDVVFGAFAIAFIALALWHLMRIGPARQALTVANLRADLHVLAGRWSSGWRGRFG